MIKDPQTLEDYYMNYLETVAPGRENAIPRHEMLRYVRMFRPKWKDRTHRDFYVKLPLCTCDEGMFYPLTPGEVKDFQIFITKQCGNDHAKRRVAIVLAARPELAPARGEQMALFGGRL